MEKSFFNSKIVGNHGIVDFSFCENNLILDNIEELTNQSIDLIKSYHLNIISYHFHKFNPVGVTGIILLSESHFSIHTWPEYNFASMDIFTCRNNFDTEKFIHDFGKILNSKEINLKKIERFMKI